MNFVFVPSASTLQLAALGMVGISSTLVILIYAFKRNRTGKLWPDELREASRSGRKEP